MTDDHATQGAGVTSLVTGGTGFTDSHLETGEPVVAAADIPVFCDHNALAMSLEKDLGFLCDNGYTTLFAREVVDILRGRTAPPRRGVVLTFDDALLSVLDVRLPLFDRYDVKATVFAITGLTPHGTVAAAGGKRDTYCLLEWDDLRKLRDSGLVELGSHGHRHNPVRVGTEAGTPISLARYSRLHDVPIEYGDGYDEAAIRAADGTPRWPAQPL